MNSCSVKPACACLADELVELERAEGRDQILRALADAAHRLGECSGILVFGSHDSYCEFVSASAALAQMTRSSALMLCPPEQVPKRGEAIGLKEGERMAVLVGVYAARDCEAIGFVWARQADLDAEGVGTLRALALAAGLALRLDHASEDARRRRENFRRRADELGHRLRNVLALVRSILRRTRQSADSADEFALHLEGRIGALARTQTALNRAVVADVAIDVDGIDIDDLVRTELTANAVRESQFRVNGPAVRLRARAAETMALALHELMTNSLKFGALAMPGGHLDVTWSTYGAETHAWLSFQWMEKGVQIASAAPRRRGFGQELIEQTLPYELGARTRFELTPGGLICSIDMPLNAHVWGADLSQLRTASRDSAHEQVKNAAL